MTTSISIHVDGYQGLVEGVPNLLDLFDKYHVKATFFVNMGREATLFQLLRYRGKKEDARKGIVSRYTKKQLLEILFLNRPLGHKHKHLLQEILKRGHEVNPHCWSHLLWSKNFEKLNHFSEIKKMKHSYIRIFKESPKGFAPPTWKYTSKIIRMLKKEGFNYLSINGPGKAPFVKEGLKIIPLSFNKNIEELLNQKLSKEEILEAYKKETSKKYVNLYFHADFEGTKGRPLFEEVLKLLGNKKTTLYQDL